MSQLLFEQLSKMGLVRKNKPNEAQIQRISANEIIDFAHQSVEFTSAKDLQREDSLFSYSSSISLSGASRYPCSNIDCRLERAQKLAQFAALYADRVYVRNIFAPYISHGIDALSPDDKDLHQKFSEDISLLLYLRPLIEAGRVIPITPPFYCPHCLLTQPFGADAEKRFDRAFRKLISTFNKEMKVTVRSIEGLVYTIEARAPELLLEHGFMSLLSEKPFPALEALPRISKQVQSGIDVQLTPSAVRKIQFDRFLVEQLYENITSELSTAQCVHTTLLTGRSLDIDILNELSGDPEIERRNQLLQKYLTTLVPFIQNADPSGLIKLRRNEEDSFMLFRNALNQAVDEYRKQGKGFAERDAKLIYADIIEPQLAQLDLRVETAKRSLIKNTAFEAISWIGAISLGMYAGFLPSDLAGVATTLGLAKVLKDLVENTLSKSNPEDAIRGEGLYFLWKVRKATKTNRRSKRT